MFFYKCLNLCGVHLNEMRELFQRLDVDILIDRQAGQILDTGFDRIDDVGFDFLQHFAVDLPFQHHQLSGRNPAGGSGIEQLDALHRAVGALIILTRQSFPDDDRLALTIQCFVKRVGHDLGKDGFLSLFIIFAVNIEDIVNVEQPQTFGAQLQIFL